MVDTPSEIQFQKVFSFSFQITCVVVTDIKSYKEENHV